MERSAEVAAALSAVYEAVSSGDEAALTETLSGAPGVLMIGSAPQDWWEDRATMVDALKAQAASGVKVHAGNIQAFEEGTVGWASDANAFIGPDRTGTPFRITAVFHKEHGAWKCVQAHASIAVAEDPQ